MHIAASGRFLRLETVLTILGGGFRFTNVASSVFTARTGCYCDSEESRKVRGATQGHLAGLWLGHELGSAGSTCRMFLLCTERTVPMQQLSNAQGGLG